MIFFQIPARFPLDPVKISLDLREISPKSGFLRRISEILARIWKFWPESRNISIGSGFSGFKGGKPKLDLPESVSGDEDLLPTRRSSRIGRFRVESGRFFGWVRYLDESEQPYI